MAKDRSPGANEVRAKLDEYGHEVGDPRPLAMPLGYRRPETLAEQVQRLVRTTISREAAEAGMETFEESEDFDTGEDDDVSSPYETFFDPVLGRDLSPAEFKANEQIYRQRYLTAQREYFRSLDRTEALQRGTKQPVPPPPAEQSGRSEAETRDKVPEKE